MNKVILIGKIATDINVKTTASGKRRLFFSLCVRKKEGREYIPCVAWDSTADLIERYCKEWDCIGIEGRLGIYKDKDGKNVMQVVVDYIEFTTEAEKKQSDDEEDFVF